MKHPILPLAAVLAALAAPAGAAAPAGFAWGAPFEVAGYGAAGPALTNFPVLVRIAEGSPSGFSYAQLQLQDGADLCFAGMDGAGLPFEIDTWNTNGESLVWVALPAMTNGTRFAMYWGGATSGKTVCAANPFAGYKGVWHMHSADPADSSPNGFDGTRRTDNLSVASGRIGAAVNVPRTSGSDGISCGNVLPNSDLAGGFTIEGWCRPTQYGGMGDGAAMFGKGGFVSLRIAGQTSVTLTTPGRKDHKMESLAGIPAAGVWWHFAATFKANTNPDGLHFYINGQLANHQRAYEVTNATDATELFLGNNQWNQAFKGDLDEMRLSASIRSADWIAATYATQADPAFLAAGEAGLLDTSAPTLSAPTIVRDADGSFTVSIIVSENDTAPGSVKCLAAGLEFPMASTNESLPKTYAATLSGLPASTTLVYSVQARSSGGDTLSRSGAETFHTGDLAVAKIADADEDGLVPGVFRISRADAGPALPVAFEIGGTAAEGRSYRAVARTATIPAGATHADVEIHPLLDPLSDSPLTVALALSPGLYGISATDGAATLSIANLTLPADRNTWIAADAGLASDAANWSFGHAPLAGEHVLFDGRFSSADCEWDALATHEVAAWTQNNGYTGTVTVCTVFPGKGAFTNLVVAGAMVVDAGSVTHPQSRVMSERHDEYWDWLGDIKSNAVYRLRLSVGSLAVGAGAMIDARGKGYYVTENGAAFPGCAHGGRMDAGSLPCYGDPREPVFIGAPYHRLWGNRWNGKGGGAIYVVAAGAIVVDGTIRADSFDGSFGFTADSYGGAFGAAGSVCLCADTVSGSGTITADGPGNGEVGNTFDDVPYVISPDNNFKGTGGRIAIRTRLPVDRSTFARITAEGFWMGSPTANWCANYSGGSGTVVFIDQTRPNGLLVLSQQPNADPPSLRPDKTTFHRCPSVTTDADWTFDAIEFGRRGFLRVPSGTTLTLTGGLAGCYGTETDSRTFGGIRYEGGTIDAGAGDQTISGNWTFFAWSNYVFSANVVVTNGATIGVPPITDIYDGGTLPAIVPTCSVEVAGDLLVGADAAIRATDCGIVSTNDYAADIATGIHSHGGRAFYRGRDATGAPESRAFDSVFAPSLPGCTAGPGLGVFTNDKTQRGGGAVRVVVGGTLTLDGTADVGGLPASRVNSGSRTGGAGGALDVTAGRLEGSGTMCANGGNYDDYAGPGGRIAVRLTAQGADFSDFTGRIEAGGGSWWKGGANPVRDASAGTVYLETADDGDKRGTIRIAMDPVNRAYIVTDNKSRHTNSNTTEMVSLGYCGDRLGDYRHARYVVADYGRAAVNADFKARSVELADLTVLLDLEGNELLVDEFFYAVDDGAGGLKLKQLGTGAHSAAAIAALGATTVADTSAGATGRVVVRGRETILILR